ncbi:MAG: nucleotide sugar dehydrogenase [Pseudomonadota bacterium]
MSSDQVIAVVGLGYVGLPLALAFARHVPTVGVDPDTAKVDAYRDGADPSGEVDAEAFAAAHHLTVTTDPAAIATADIIVVAVPTPVDEAHKPDMSALRAASRSVGQYMKAGATVVFESTVYPGATEEICVPILEEASGRSHGSGFSVGYSPERINPGDRERTLEKIVKVVAGDTRETCERLAAMYGRVVEAGIYQAESIRVAEAAKVIENVQRDINIALVNEIAVICHRLGIDTGAVLDAASSKWNFLPFRPGLVGGHCIGVDPYYLTYQAERVGYHPEMILAGRRLNDGMARFIATEIIRELIDADRPIKGADVIVLGATFKENCADLRNSKAIDLVRELEAFGCRVHLHDPLASDDACRHEYDRALTTWDALPTGDALVLAVAHEAYLTRPLSDLADRVCPGGLIADVKGALAPSAVQEQNLRLWRL